MWFVWAMLMSLVGGTILGIGMRAWDEWRERADAEAAKEVNTQK